MADIIKVDTERVAATAKSVETYNNTIRDDFASVESAIKALNNVWDGSASTNAISAFYDIKSAFYGPRYDVVNQYVHFLRHQVDPSYTQAENANKSLADAFK
jgi:uncharacterized protein YukE